MSGSLIEGEGEGNSKGSVMFFDMGQEQERKVMREQYCRLTPSGYSYNGATSTVAASSGATYVYMYMCYRMNMCTRDLYIYDSSTNYVLS